MSSYRRYYAPPGFGLFGGRVSAPKPSPRANRWTSRRRVEVGLHEAGHCLCVVAYGGTIASASIDPNLFRDGQVRFDVPREGFSPFQAGVVAMGGVAGSLYALFGEQALEAPLDRELVNQNLQAWLTDLQTAVRAADQHHGLADETLRWRFLADTAGAAGRLLRANLPALHMLSARLLEHGTLTHESVAEVVRAAAMVGPR